MEKETLIELKHALLEFGENTKWWRELTPHEKRVKLSEIEKTFNESEESYVEDVAEILKGSLTRIVSSIKKILKNESIVDLQNIRVGYHDKMVNVIRERLISLYLYGKQSVYEELGKTDAVVRKSQRMMLWYRVKAEAIVTELEGKLKARALYIVLDGIRKNRPDKEIISEIIGLSERCFVDYSCVMAKAPKTVSDLVYAYRKLIDEDDFSEKDAGFDDPHITICYGLTTDYVNDLAGVLEQNGGYNAVLGGTTSFTSNEDYDVLKIDVDSPDIKRQHERIMRNKNLEVKSDFDRFRPHLTLAYLKKGRARKYVGDNKFDSVKIKIKKVVFSPSDEGKKEVIGLSEKFVDYDFENSTTIKLQELFNGRLGSLIDIIKNFLIGSAGVQVVSAVSEGRSDAFGELRSEIGAYQWSAILDHKTCPVCRNDASNNNTGLDGLYFSPDDPLLDMLWPPVHAHCRCMLVGVLQDELENYPVKITRLTYSDVKRWTKNKFWLSF